MFIGGDGLIMQFCIEFAVPSTHFTWQTSIDTFEQFTFIFGQIGRSLLRTHCDCPINELIEFCCAQTRDAVQYFLEVNLNLGTNQHFRHR